MSALTVPSPRRGFVHIPGPYGTLVVPHERKFRWESSERPFRSVIVAADGRVVSAGWPKFANHDEPGFEDHTRALQQALRDGSDVRVTDKLDGSLCVRSVIAGRVVLRTRGTHDGGMFADAMREVARRRYPALLDPAFEADRSLLLEFVSPSFRVVLPYPDDDLILTGAVRHDTFSLADWDDLHQVAATGSLRLVEAHPVPGSLRELARTVRDWEGSEGVVARCCSGQVLVKVKAKGYLTMHRLRSRFTLREIRRLCSEQDVHTLADFEKAMRRLGADWEILTDVKPVIEALIDARQHARERIDRLDAQVLAVCMRHPGRRKDVTAELHRTMPATELQAALLLADGQTDAAANALESALVDAALADAAVDDRDELFAA